MTFSTRSWIWKAGQGRDVCTGGGDSGEVESQKGGGGTLITTAEAVVVPQRVSG